MMASAETSRDRVRWASGFNIVAGLWLVLSPWIYGYREQEGAWNSILVGLTVVVLAGLRASGRASASWISWFNTALGVWVILSPLLYYDDTFNQWRIWNSLLVGAAISTLGLVSASSGRRPGAGLWRSFESGAGRQR